MPMDLQPSPGVRRRMQRTAQRDNEFERAVRSLLHARGLRYRIHHKLPGLKRTTSDIAFPGLRIAIFLDGCFWHGCEIHPPSVKKNTGFWLQKIERNRARDIRATSHLVSLGWTVLRFWEHETTESIAETIFSAVQEARASSPRVRGALQNVERSTGKLEAVDGDEALIEAQVRK